MTEKEWTQKAKMLNKQLGASHEPFSSVGLRANYRCEYCGFDVLSSRQAWHGTHWDLILPKMRHPTLALNFNNYALACASCNTLKHDYDPACNEPRWQDLIDLTDEERELLIQRVAKYILSIQESWDKTILSARQLLRLCND